MINPAKLELEFQKFTTNLQVFAPDGIIPVNVSLMQSFGLLKGQDGKMMQTQTDDIKRYFYIIETPEKITLFNDKFSVWIVPTIANRTPATYVLIAINKGENTDLEVVFSATGVYNISNIILNILECFLKEIQDNENTIKKISGW